MSPLAYVSSAFGWAKGYTTGQHKFEIPYEDVKYFLVVKPTFSIFGKLHRTLHGEPSFIFHNGFPDSMVHELTKPAITAKRTNLSWISPKAGPDASFSNEPKSQAIESHAFTTPCLLTGN